MYYQVTLVPVPLSLRRDLDWQDKAPAHRLAALVSRLVGAPHLGVCQNSCVSGRGLMIRG